MWNSLLAFFFLLSSMKRSLGQISEFSELPSPQDNIYAQDGGGVWEFPRGCTTDCRRISWVSDSGSRSFIIKFRITTFRVGYVAIAISHDKKMGYDDAYICSKDPSSTNSGVYSAYLKNHTHPIILDEMSSGNITWEGDRMMCQFSRPLRVTKTIENLRVTWDMAINNYNILYAEGGVDDVTGTLHQHSFRTSTYKAFDLHRTTGYPRAPQESQASFRNGRLLPDNLIDSSVHASDAIYSSNDLSQGMWFVSNENDCPDGRHCTLIYWKRANLQNNPNLLRFVMIGQPRGWMAMAISRDMAMGGDDCYICTKNFSSEISSQFLSAYLEGTRSPVIVSQMEGVFPRHSTIANGRLVCIFDRNISVTKNVHGSPKTWDLGKQNFNLLYAEGDVGRNGQLLYHSFAKHTRKRFNFLNTSGYKNLTASKFSPTEITQLQESSQFLSEDSSTTVPRISETSSPTLPTSVSNAETSPLMKKLTTNIPNTSNGYVTNLLTNEHSVTSTGTPKRTTQKTSTFAKDGKKPRRRVFLEDQFVTARRNPVSTTTPNSACSFRISYHFLAFVFVAFLTSLSLL